MKNMKPVNSWSEFQPLKRVVLGAPFPPETFDWNTDKETREVMRQIFEETAEDIAELEKIFIEHGVEVVRPKNIFTITGEEQIQLPWMHCGFPNHPLMPRDTLMPYGNTIFECFTGSDNRYFENLAYYDHVSDWFSKGADWVSMPGAMIESGKDHKYFSENGRVLYDAANMIKCGDTVLFSQPYEGDNKRGRGTSLGKEWMQRELTIRYPGTKFLDIPVGGHIDGKIALLAPGTLMTWHKEWVPDEMKHWNIIEVDDTSDMPQDFLSTKKKRFYKEYVEKWLYHWVGYADESVFDVNVLSLDEKTVICTGYNEKAFAEMEAVGITPILWRFRHQYFWDGGIHCLTSDIQREGDCENYV
jgi:N-dimethylarginine dimethylaminohydrolase